MMKRNIGIPLMAIAIMAFCLSAVPVFADEVAISELSLSQTGHLQTNEPITVTANAEASDGQIIYYKFYYCANYGTDDYDTSPWTVVQDYSTTNSAVYTFSSVGNYIIVVRAVTDPDNEPEALPIIGQAVVVGDNSQVSLVGMIADATTETNAGDTVIVTATASGPDGQSLYYEFYYCANYGTSSYDTTPWTLVQEYSTSNSAEYTFPTAGNYIIVVRAVTDPNNEPTALPIVGSAISIGDTTAIIIDHTCTDLSLIPQSWINQSKSDLRLSYGHTSHGSQPLTGMQTLMDAYSTYAFNSDGAIQADTLSLADYTPGGDLGHNGDTSWADRTRTYLDGPGSDRNVVIWSWCGGVSDNSETGIDAYLSAMNQLEGEYPSITFVYMTGHLDGSGEAGNLHIMNNRIRSYCRENNKILFDFADIESYAPDGQYYLDRGADDGNYYESGNWAQEWCVANPGLELCTDCGYDGCCAHSQPLNCNLKARAFWWMLARIAGWE